MRISDWSSDVCSSDLEAHPGITTSVPGALRLPGLRHAALWERPWPLPPKHNGVGYSPSASSSFCASAPGSVSTPLSWRSIARVRTPAALMLFCTVSSCPCAFSSTPANLPKDRKKHTSELQSLMRISYAVFCLNKKMNPQNTSNHIHSITGHNH